MPGPAPKPSNLRQRRNKTATAAQLPAGAPRGRKPKLPAREGYVSTSDGETLQKKEWHALTLAWWKDIWCSPMAAEYLQADIHGLYILADLVDRYWREPSQGLAAEIRLQRQCFGLTPIDRRRLQWEVEKVEAVKRKPPKAPAREGEDPRKLLTLVR